MAKISLKEKAILTGVGIFILYALTVGFWFLQSGSRKAAKNVLKKEQENVHWEQLIPEMQKCGIHRFAQVLTEICVKKLGLEVTTEALRIPEGDKQGHALVDEVLSDIMKGPPSMHKENFAQKCLRIAHRFVRMWRFRALADENYLTLVWNNFAFSSYLKRRVEL